MLSCDVFLKLCNQEGLFSKQSQNKFLEIEEGHSNKAIMNLRSNFDVRAFQMVQRLEIVGYETWSLRRYLLLAKGALNDPFHSYSALLSFSLLEKESYLCVNKRELLSLMGPLGVFTSFIDPHPHLHSTSVQSTSGSPYRRKSMCSFFGGLSGRNMSRSEQIKTLFRSRTLTRLPQRKVSLSNSAINVLDEVGGPSLMKATL